VACKRRRRAVALSVSTKGEPDAQSTGRRRARWSSASIWASGRRAATNCAALARIARLIASNLQGRRRFDLPAGQPKTTERIDGSASGPPRMLAGQKVLTQFNSDRVSWGAVARAAPAEKYGGGKYGAAGPQQQVAGRRPAPPPPPPPQQQQQQQQQQDEATRPSSPAN
jgi:hypothetical protein